MEARDAEPIVRPPETVGLDAGAMDGRELIEYIRTQSWQAEVPVLMVTSEQNMGRLAAVERAGVSAICDKPFEAGSIRRLISDALTR